MIFLGYSVVRRVPLAWELLSLALVALAMVGPKTLDSHECLPCTPAAGCGRPRAGLSRLAGRHCAAARSRPGLFVAAGHEGGAKVWPTVDWGLIALQLLLVALMAVGAWFDDGVGRIAQICAWRGLLGLGLAASIHVPAIGNAAGQPRPLVYRCSSWS